MIKNIIAASICGGFIISATILEIKGHKVIDQVTLAAIFGLIAALMK